MKTVHALIQNYERFFDSACVRNFTSGGGKVFIAIENRPVEAVQALYSIGHRDFSEKFVQESGEKNLSGIFPEINLHYFGCLQSNKIKKSVHLFDGIESIEKASAAAKLKKAMVEGGKCRLKRAFVEMNAGGEPQKKGVSPFQADDLIRYCQELGLPLAGLMTIPPRHENPEPYFRLLRDIADRHRLDHCYMGMSDDFKLAIRCGATAIRIARAIFSDPVSSRSALDRDRRPIEANAQ